MKKPTKKRERIYIFPNQYGFLGFALFLIMLVAGATYQNNLVFMMAFLIISLSLVAILQTARNLRDLDVLSLNVESNFAGHSTTAYLNLTNRSGDPKVNLELIAEYIGENKSKLKFKTAFMATNLETSATGTFKSTFTLPAKRGEYKLRRLRVGTSAPYGLFGSWIYLQCKSNFFVYPEPLGTRQLPHTTHAMGEDFSGHKNYVVGDSMNRIDWKIFSRHRELFVKEYLDGANPRLEFTYNDQAENLVEQQLSQLALWLMIAREKNYDFRLNMPHFQTAFAADATHYMRCMKEIATWAA